MKQLYRVLSLGIALLFVATAFAGCGESSAVVDPVDTVVTRPTVPIPEGMMTIHDVLIKSGSGTNLQWSDISPYTHTDTDENNAVFEVTDEYAGEYTLTVVHDGETIESSILTKGEHSIDIRTDSVTAFWREIMIEQQNENN